MTKQGQLRIKLYVEGITEKNYFNDLRKNNNVKIVYKPINMKGGGYSKYLKEINKDSSDSGYIAAFVLIDLDRLIDNPFEKEPFGRLLEYCQKKSKNGKIPYFIITTNRNFEFFVCSHCPNYKENDTKLYIEKTFKKSVDNFKSDKKIYEFLNQNSRSFNNAIKKIDNPKRKPYICHKYEKNDKTLDIKIKIKETIKTEDALQYYHSNIYELFDIIGVEI